MRRRFTVSGYIAYVLFAIGVGVAGYSAQGLTQTLLVSGAVFCGFGLLCCVLTVFFHSGPIISNPTQSLRRLAANNFSFLLLNQMVFLGISIALFYFLESQTQVNARLHPVQSGYILQQIVEHPLLLGLFPWMLYSILGIGLAYWSVCFQRQPLLWRAVTWEKENKFGFFWHNVLMIVTDVVTIGPFVFITSFALVWLGESACSFFEWDSLFLKPIRTTFLCSILILMFRKSNKQLVEWMDRYKISVGKTLLIYCIVFGFCLVWMHSVATWLFSGLEIEIPIENLKSPLVGFFSEAGLKTRMSLLIWGWWIIWIPWMASVVARASIGASVIGALVQASVFPLFIFCVLLTQILPEHTAWIVNNLQSTPGKIIGIMTVLLFINLAWGNMRTYGEMSKGMMSPIGRTSKRSLVKWMSLVISWLMCYIPGWFVLGWFLMQFMVTLGGLFMTVVIAFFLFGWGMSLFSAKRPIAKLSVSPSAEV